MTFTFTEAADPPASIRHVVARAVAQQCARTNDPSPVVIWVDVATVAELCHRLDYGDIPGPTIEADESFTARHDPICGVLWLRIAPDAVTAARNAQTAISIQGATIQ